MLDAAQSRPHSTAQIVQRCIALQVDVGVTGLPGIERRTEEYQWIIVAAEVPDQHAGRTKLGGRVLDDEGSMFFTPHRFDADMRRKVDDRSPASGDCQEIGRCRGYFSRVKIPDGDISQTSFSACFGAGIENGRTEMHRDPLRHCSGDTGPSGPGAHIINTYYMNSGIVKPNCITVSV